MQKVKTTQIAIRLPIDAVRYIDAVARDNAESRAGVILAALNADRRRRRDERDAAIYAASQPDPELDAFVADTTKRIDLSDLD